jgi:hypothetical protein
LLLAAEDLVMGPGCSMVVFVVLVLVLVLVLWSRISGEKVIVGGSEASDIYERV